MDKIFITGSTGFIGTHLLDYLKNQNQNVIGVSRFKNELTQTIDYSDLYKELKKGNNTIIHLAGKAHNLKKELDPNSYFEINYELTKKVYDSFLKSESEIFIYMSSVKAVEDSLCGVLTEKDFPKPTTVYGLSKLKAEEYILANLPKNKRIYILRPCMVYGTENKGNLNLLYKMVSTGIPWPLASFDNKRSFLSVDNLNFIILKIINNKDIDSGVYNLADDESLSTNEIVNLIYKVLGKKVKLWRIPKKMIILFSKIGDVFNLPLNSERLNKLIGSYLVSNKKIKDALKIEKMPFSTYQSLEKTFEKLTPNK